MKFLLSLIFTFTFCITNANATETACSQVYSYLVFEEKTGDILSETRSDKISYPASLVKLMTLYLTFEALENHQLTSDQSLSVSAHGEEVGKVNKVNTMNLKEGDKITVREAIRAVIIKSFNEAAVTLAEGVSGSEWEFVRKMNEKAQELGMFDTSFRNASGLHEEGQYTNSYDLARLVLALRKNFPDYYHLFSLKEFTYRGTKYETHNHVLVEYKGAEGMKTGFTNAAGFNLITAAKKNDQRVISVLLGCASISQRDNLTKELLDNAFKQLAEKHNSHISVKLVKSFDYASKKSDGSDYEEEMYFGMR